MERHSTVRLLILASMVMEIWIARAELVNRSASGGPFWSTAKDGEDLVGQEETDESVLFLNERDEFDGGFSSLDGMLQWAIGHSDPAKLQETAEGIQRLSTNGLKKRQMETKEWMEKMKMPTDAQLMQIAINDLNNSSLPLEIRYRVLEELLVLVEPIDNANDLQKVGGLAVVIGELANPDHGIRTISAWILGKASQNNHIIQKQVLELGGLLKLMMMVKSSFIEEAIKALYAVSALIRHNLDGQKLFLTEAGGLILQEILSNSSIDIRLRKKSVLLVADLAECELETEEAELLIFNNRFLLKSVVDLIASTDLDLQEKALSAIKNLLQLRSVDALIFKEFCGLDGILERLRQLLQQWIIQENQREFAMDVENLRREVQMIYLSKLDKVMRVPT